VCYGFHRRTGKRRNIDKEWGTEIYSMSDIDALFEKLEGLR
jgi:hypothetical protein